MTQDESLIRQGWAWRVRSDAPGVAILVPPAELSALGHDLRYTVPEGYEEYRSSEDRRKQPQ